MEPGECTSNVIAFNNFASINYEYFESQTVRAGIAREHLQRTEAGWRQEGRLVHYDPCRDGIWVFQNATGTGTPTKHNEISAIDVQGLGLLLKDKGTYEPASLARGKQASNVLTTPSTSSSPSSSLESALRNVQAFNARSVQTNSNIGLMQDPPTPSPGPKPELHNSLKDMHENFISSVLSSTVYFLCHDHGFIPLNSRTLILPSSDSPQSSLRPGNGIELATLDISLTSLGVLVIKAYADMAPGLQTSVSATTSASIAGGLSPGSSLWLAPSGTAAKLHKAPDEKNLPSSTSIAQLQEDPLDSRSNGTNNLTINGWQSRCLEWLSVKGLNSTALEAGGWLHVQILGGHNPYYNSDLQATPILDESAIVPWPALLCFQTSAPRSQDPQLWGSGPSDCRDPLSFAEEWLTSGDERAATVSKRQKEREAVEALSREQADLEARAQQSNTYSPAALRRSSNAGAMYPTPPDAPQPHVGATPSFDGNASTPGNPNHLIAQDTSSIVPSNRSAADVDNELWGSSGKKERRISGNQYSYNDKDSDHENDNGNEHLFGDIGGDMFGTHITDDDFNFFDEPDVDDFDQKVPSPLPENQPGIQEGTIMSNNPSSSDIMLQALETHDLELASTDHGDPSRQINNLKISHPIDITAQIPTFQQKDVKVEAVQLPQPHISLPFNKEAIFQRLDQEQRGHKIHKQFRRASLFGQIVFEESLQSVNKKYSSHGQFSFCSKKKPRKLEIVSGLPQTDYLTSRRKSRDNILEMRHVARILGEKKLDSEPNLRDPIDYLLGSDEGSPVSEQDDSSHATEEPLISPQSGMKRKWESDDQDDIASTFDGLAVDFELCASTPQSTSGSQMPLLDADPAGWALTTYFTSPEPAVDAEPNILTDLECIATAQILADQAISGTLRLPDTASNETYMLPDTTSATRRLMYSLSQALKSCLTDGNTCTMRSFLDIQGIPVLNQALRLPPRPMQNPRGPIGQDARPNNPFPIPPPQLEVRRSETRMSILPASVPFWENLGLGPSRGTKDVNAVCVYPNLDGLARYASTFLDQMKSVYESSRFGAHDRLASKEIDNGLLPFAIDILPQNKMQNLTVLREIVSRLSRNLASLTAGEKNHVVYFVYPVDNKVLLVHICSAFQHLFNLYRKALSERRTSPTNELVLQLIPMDFIASPTSLAVPLPLKYFHLSMEVYDRCIDFSSSTSSPAIMLEQPLPRTIDFKLSLNPSASLLQENTCLHIAYAQSIDDRWITAAWTDNRGTRQMTASYCLGRKNEPISTPFMDVANEIWETTLQVISSKNIHWRIIIARVGVMDNTELDFWTGLASTESNAQISLTLVTVQTNPSLRLLPAPVTLTPNGSTAQTVFTPVSTPQALQSSIGSPDTVTTLTRGVPSSSTPVEALVEPDSDARLVDHTDQSWGAVLSHRLNNSNSLVETNPALISGYLLKRGGFNNNDPPVIMEVNIVHSEVVGNPRTFHESILREILGYYRGLGTLARTRGVVDAVKDIRPWHIAAAEKAVKALYMLM
ncbi:unnamed protein product [Diplocarpon coronariae]|uniref:Mediator of RNA polymerase II transcription subunit 13 n=1 Tax=Diplocarpon coronariae TaxID=2795749 RepID=A0A218YZE4_9HELO|nr:hypothetical protein B2J93_1326 [Marssonina coronariae]